MLSARRYCAPASLRAASYSANPPRKNGTLEDLVYNDALYRGRRPGMKPLASGWKVERKPKTSNEPFPLPDHKYVFESNPMPLFGPWNGRYSKQGGDAGRYVGQKIDYDEILPRCEGKTSPLKWKNLTEEDRYTRRNWTIRGLKKAAAGEIAPSNCLHDKAGNAQDAFNIPSMLSRWWPLALVFVLILQGNSNGRKELNDMSEVASQPNFFFTVPVLRELYQVYLNYIYVKGTENRHELWAEATTGANLVKTSQMKHTELTTPYYSVPRNIGEVPVVPPETFREANELYYDGAEGPDKIGHYNVYNWKHGEASQNPEVAGNLGELKDSTRPSAGTLTMGIF